MDGPVRCDPDQLVALVRAGDLAALERVTRCLGERLLAVGRRHGRDEQDARDAVQDALLTAGHHLGDYRGDGSVESWVTTMAARACFRMRRGRANDPGLHVRDVELVADDDPEVLAGRAELVQALGEALLELPATDRAVLLLAEAEDWTGPEIAAKLGTTPNAVRTRLSRARGLNRRYRRRIMQYSRPRMAHGGRGLPPWTSTSALPEANA